jgi:hypothetical protein
MAGRRQRLRERRQQLEAMLATGQARLRAKSKSLVGDTMVGVVRRERPVAGGILAAPRPRDVSWTALVPGACLFARLAVAAAELNATLWERRRAAGPSG